jgi:hypothetical protein
MALTVKPTTPEEEAKKKAALDALNRQAAEKNKQAMQPTINGFQTGLTDPNSAFAVAPYSSFPTQAAGSVAGSPSLPSQPTASASSFGASTPFQSSSFTLGPTNAGMAAASSQPNAGSQPIQSGQMPATSPVAPTSEPAKLPYTDVRFGGGFVRMNDEQRANFEKGGYGIYDTQGNNAVGVRPEDRVQKTKFDPMRVPTYEERRAKEVEDAKKTYNWRAGVADRAAQDAFERGDRRTGFQEAIKAEQMRQASKTGKVPDRVTTAFGNYRSDGMQGFVPVFSPMGPQQTFGFGGGGFPVAGAGGAGAAGGAKPASPETGTDATEKESEQQRSERIKKASQPIGIADGVFRPA